MEHTLSTPAAVPEKARADDAKIQASCAAVPDAEHAHDAQMKASGAAVPDKANAHDAQYAGSAVLDAAHTHGAHMEASSAEAPATPAVPLPCLQGWGVIPPDGDLSDGDACAEVGVKAACAAAVCNGC